MSAADHEMERDLEADMRRPGSDPDPAPESLLRLMDLTDMEDLGGKERVKAQVQEVLSRAQGGSAKQTEAAVKAVWEERDRRVAREQERKERDAWPADQCNVEGEVTRSGGAFLIVNGDVLVPGRLYSKARHQPRVGDRVRMDVRRARGSREAGSSMRGCEWAATSLKVVARVSEAKMLQSTQEGGSELVQGVEGHERSLKEILVEGEAIRDRLSIEEQRTAYEEALAQEKRIRRNGWLDDDPDNKGYVKRFPLIGKKARKLWGGAGSVNVQRSRTLAIAGGTAQLLEKGGRNELDEEMQGTSDWDSIRWNGKGDIGGEEDDSDSYDAIEHAKRDLMGPDHDGEGGEDWLFEKDEEEVEGAMTGAQDKPWWMATEDEMPAVKKSLDERRRLLAEGNNTYALFDRFGRKMFQERIPSCTPPWMIPSDWHLREYIGCAWGGYTNRMMRFIHEGFCACHLCYPTRAHT